MAANYNNIFYKDYEILLKKLEKLENENKMLLLRATIAEDEQKRLQRIIDKQNGNLAILQKENFELTRENQRLMSIQNIDGTTSGIPTSQTPIGKKKVIPNFAKNTGEKIGRKKGHKKDKLEKINDNKINEHIEHTLELCPNCDSKDLVETGNIVSKDVVDYKLVVTNSRHYFKEYKCSCCGKIVREKIPNHLKEECQYGSNVKCLSLALTNIGNVPFNKIKRIISGLSMEEIEPCEGYLAKLQKQASKGLESFIKELHNAAINSNMIAWDDTVIAINKKQACMRYYGNDSFCLFKAHEKKDKEGLDKDNILKLLPKTTVVEHDHNKVNYNSDYSFINAECCQHLLRDLKKVEINIPSRTWCTKTIKLFQEYDHKRKELINMGIDRFEGCEIDEFIYKLDSYLLSGLEENEKDNSSYYSNNEKTLIYRIMEYRDNYIYWILDFDIPFTNNQSERKLRGIKSKMKVSGQFQNVDRASDYANIRSYIETCRLYGKNEYDALKRLIEGNPYSYNELIQKDK